MQMQLKMLYICVLKEPVMETIRLEFQPSIKAKILELLSSFTSEELIIVQEDPDFDENKRKLKVCADQIDNGTARLVSFEEMDRLLETTLSKYED
jgi:hypothetical protein